MFYVKFLPYPKLCIRKTKRRLFEAAKDEDKFSANNRRSNNLKVLTYAGWRGGRSGDRGGGDIKLTPEKDFNFPNALRIFCTRVFVGGGVQRVGFTTEKNDHIT